MGYIVQLGDRGRLVLPAEIRKAMGLRPGDRLALRLEEDGSLRLVASNEVLRAARGMYKHLRQPGESWVGELLAERRAEVES